MFGVVQIVIAVVLSTVAFFYGYMFSKHQLGNDVSQCKETTDKPSPIKLVQEAVLEQPSRSANDALTIQLVLNKHPKMKKDEILTYENTNPRALEDVFSMYHHPSHPLTSELLLHRGESSYSDSDPYQPCHDVYLTRTGSLANMPNKCLAVAVVEESMADATPHYHRRGKISGMENMYQHDFIDDGALRAEAALLPDFMRSYGSLIEEFKRLAGDRREVVVMVLNEGVLDVFMNYICSLKASEPSQEHILDQLVVFAGQSSLVPLLQAVGVKALHHEGLGNIPAKAAAFYGDFTFALLMWLKTTSVLIAASAGYHVLFQDVDLVWLKDPLPPIRSLIEQYEVEQKKNPQSLVTPDIFFMDDGARTPRFTPLYVNSGFYYVRPTPRSVYVFLRIATAISQIAVSHSHQSVLTRHVHEAIDLFGLRFAVLSLKDFPSGFHYHHEKKYMESLRNFVVQPYVFHMCWTESRKQKVEYLQALGMWFLPNENQTALYEHCGTVTALKASLQEMGKASAAAGQKVLERCCLRGDYWTKRSEHEHHM